MNRLGQALTEIVGNENVFTEDLDLYLLSRDASVTTERGRPIAIVMPTSTTEVAQIVRFANRERIPIVPRGAGSNLSGGAIPSRGGVIVDLSRMNRILEINEDDLVAVVEPGVVWTLLDEELRRLGYFFPPDPASGDAATLGGMVGECAGGMRAVKYGTVKECVIGFEVVTAKGHIVKTGSRCMKCVSGYDLTHLYTGSEGTLGIVTKIILKIKPLPEFRTVILGLFDDLKKVGNCISKVMKSRLFPAILEVMDRTCIKASDAYAKIGLPECEALILMELDGPREGVLAQVKSARMLFLESGATRVEVADDPLEMERLWLARKSVIPALASIKPTVILEDITVPLSKISEMVVTVQQISKNYDVTIATFGHAGDGNLHPTIIVDERNEDEFSRANQASEELLKLAIKFNGTLTGEHGIGVTKSHMLLAEHGKEAVDLMKDVKSALDPIGLMNPGKIFSAE